LVEDKRGGRKSKRRSRCGSEEESTLYKKKNQTPILTRDGYATIFWEGGG